jgi:hypothetical protein
MREQPNPKMDETPSIIDRPELSNGDLIRKLAYEIYLKRGMEDGHDVEDWLEAEKEICFKTNSVVEEVAA